MKFAPDFGQVVRLTKITIVTCAPTCALDGVFCVNLQ